jgi:hypothetical protein
MTGLVVVRAYAIGLTSPAKPLFALTAALRAASLKARPRFPCNLRYGPLREDHCNRRRRFGTIDQRDASPLFGERRTAPAAGEGKPGLVAVAPALTSTAALRLRRSPSGRALKRLPPILACTCDADSTRVGKSAERHLKHYRSCLSWGEEDALAPREGHPEPRVRKATLTLSEGNNFGAFHLKTFD